MHSTYTVSTVQCADCRAVRGGLAEKGRTELPVLPAAGNFRAGKDGTIQKRLCGREQECLRQLMGDCLRPFVPEYRGQVGNASLYQQTSRRLYVTCIYIGKCG